MPKPTPEQIQEAVAAGLDRQAVAMAILGAAADYEPRRWGR